MSLLEVSGLRKVFGSKGNFLKPGFEKLAVADVAFEVAKGETLALVGESGSGKSTVGMMILGLLEPTAGSVKYDGKDVFQLRGADRLWFRRQIQVVFQDPYGSLNGRLTAGQAVMEGMAIHRIGANFKEREQKAEELLAAVGMPADSLNKYPHEFSGGQRQRIAIARALSVEPSFMVLDEPTSALDVSVQSQVLNLLRRLQAERGLSFLFITHNLAVVEYMADRVCVMSQGEIVERGSVDDIFDHPQQAYTQRLLSSIPKPDPEARSLMAGA